MSMLRALARVQALAAGRAQPIATVRHLHLADPPLVLVPLTLAGEANAPLALLAGTDPATPRLLVVPQPRNRDLRTAFHLELAEILLPYLEAHRSVTEAVATDRGRDVRHRYVDAPQILLPNSAGITFLRLLGRATRFAETEGEYAVPAVVPLLGRWLTFLAERAEHPGSALTVALTEALGLHWATGQSNVEDQHLPALLAWIDPPAGTPGDVAARAAEFAPPAGPATDPEFDNEVLAPLITAYEEAGEDPQARQEAYDRLATALRGQLAGTWELMWRGVALLRALPEGARAPGRWDGDKDAFTAYAEHVDEGGAPQPRRDGAVAAAGRLHRLERALQSYAVQRAYDDPLVLAEYRLAGEAFAGEVTMADPARIDDTGKRPVLRPRIMVVTADAVTLQPGAKVQSPVRPAQSAKVVFVTRLDDGRTQLVLELVSGMGRGLTAAPGSVPQVGERLTYTTLSDAYLPSPALPEPDRTPWTHGGPPPDREPAG